MTKAASRRPLNERTPNAGCRRGWGAFRIEHPLADNNGGAKDWFLASRQLIA